MTEGICPPGCMWVVWGFGRRFICWWFEGGEWEWIESAINSESEVFLAKFWELGLVTTTS